MGLPYHRRSGRSPGRLPGPGWPGRRNRIPAIDATDSAQRIRAVIRAIPRGEVRAYGEVASRAGLPGRARLVARLLSEGGGDLPWHRVLRSDGRIAFPPGSEGHDEQARRLRAEGVAVDKGRVRMRSPGQRLDASLWGPR